MRADHEIIINVIRCNHGSSKFNYCIPYFTFCCFSIIIILKCNDDIRRIAKKVLTMIDLSHMIQDMTTERTEERKNRFNGESVMLTKEEAKIHDRLFINELAATLEDKAAGVDGVSKLWDKVRADIEWFTKHNAKAYMVLLD